MDTEYLVEQLVWCLEVEVQWHRNAALVAYEYLSSQMRGWSVSKYLRDTQLNTLSKDQG